MRHRRFVLTTCSNFLAIFRVVCATFWFARCSCGRSYILYRYGSGRFQRAPLERYSTLRVAKTAIAARSSNEPYRGSCDIASQLPISSAERSSAIFAVTIAECLAPKACEHCYGRDYLTPKGGSNGCGRVLYMCIMRKDSSILYLFGTPDGLGSTGPSDASCFAHSIAANCSFALVCDQAHAAIPNHIISPFC